MSWGKLSSRDRRLYRRRKKEKHALAVRLYTSGKAEFKHAELRTGNSILFITQTQTIISQPLPGGLGSHVESGISNSSDNLAISGK
jgi:hypothetical protein